MLLSCLNTARVSLDIKVFLSKRKAFSRVLDDILPSAGKTVKIMSNGTVQMINVYYLEIACAINVCMTRRRF